MLKSGCFKTSKESVQQKCWSTVDENCAKFESQTDRIYYVQLRQTFLGMEVEIVKLCSYGIRITKQIRKK